MAGPLLGTLPTSPMTLVSLKKPASQLLPMNLMISYHLPKPAPPTVLLFDFLPNWIDWPVDAVTRFEGVEVRVGRLGRAWLEVESTDESGSVVMEMSGIEWWFPLAWLIPLMVDILWKEWGRETGRAREGGTWRLTIDEVVLPPDSLCHSLRHSLKWFSSFK